MKKLLIAALAATFSVAPSMTLVSCKSKQTKTNELSSEITNKNLGKLSDSKDETIKKSVLAKNTNLKEGDFTIANIKKESTNQQNTSTSEWEATLNGVEGRFSGSADVTFTIAESTPDTTPKNTIIQTNDLKTKIQNKIDLGKFSKIEDAESFVNNNNLLEDEQGVESVTASIDTSSDLLIKVKITLKEGYEFEIGENSNEFLVQVKLTIEEYTIKNACQSVLEKYYDAIGDAKDALESEILNIKGISSVDVELNDVDQNSTNQLTANINYNENVSGPSEILFDNIKINIPVDDEITQMLSDLKANSYVSKEALYSHLNDEIKKVDSYNEKINKIESLDIVNSETNNQSTDKINLKIKFIFKSGYVSKNEFFNFDVNQFTNDATKNLSRINEDLPDTYYNSKEDFENQLKNKLINLGKVADFSEITQWNEETETNNDNKKVEYKFKIKYIGDYYGTDEFSGTIYLKNNITDFITDNFKDEQYKYFDSSDLAKNNVKNVFNKIKNILKITNGKKPTIESCTDSSVNYIKLTIPYNDQIYQGQKEYKIIFNLNSDASDTIKNDLNELSNKYYKPDEVRSKYEEYLNASEYIENYALNISDSKVNISEVNYKKSYTGQKSYNNIPILFKTDLNSEIKGILAENAAKYFKDNEEAQEYFHQKLEAISVPSAKFSFETNEAEKKVNFDLTVSFDENTNYGDKEFSGSFNLKTQVNETQIEEIENDLNSTWFDSNEALDAEVKTKFDGFEGIDTCSSKWENEKNYVIELTYKEEYYGTNNKLTITPRIKKDLSSDISTVINKFENSYYNSSSDAEAAISKELKNQFGDEISYEFAWAEKVGTLKLTYITGYMGVSEITLPVYLKNNMDELLTSAKNDFAKLSFNTLDEANKKASDLLNALKDKGLDSFTISESSSSSNYSLHIEVKVSEKAFVNNASFEWNVKVANSPFIDIKDINLEYGNDNNKVIYQTYSNENLANKNISFKLDNNLGYPLSVELDKSNNRLKIEMKSNISGKREITIHLKVEGTILPEKQFKVILKGKPEFQLMEAKPSDNKEIYRTRLHEEKRVKFKLSYYDPTVDGEFSFAHENNPAYIKCWIEHIDGDYYNFVFTSTPKPGESDDQVNNMDKNDGDGGTNWVDLKYGNTVFTRIITQIRNRPLITQFKWANVGSFTPWGDSVQVNKGTEVSEFIEILDSTWRDGDILNGKTTDNDNVKVKNETFELVKIENGIRYYKITLVGISKNNIFGKQRCEAWLNGIRIANFWTHC